MREQYVSGPGPSPVWANRPATVPASQATTATFCAPSLGPELHSYRLTPDLTHCKRKLRALGDRSSRSIELTMELAPDSHSQAFPERDWDSTDDCHLPPRAPGNAFWKPRTCHAQRSTALTAQQHEQSGFSHLNQVRLATQRLSGGLCSLFSLYFLA